VSNPVFTTEELRVVAMSSSARRGKSVARRRLFWRWIAWFLWRVLLPFIGLVTVMAALVGLTFWLYVGHAAAYVQAQKWVQQEFGSFQTAKPTGNINKASNATQIVNTNLLPNSSENTSMIKLTDEATPDLQLDHQLTIKTKP
jgi:type II secretory pathway component PulL